MCLFSLGNAVFLQIFNYFFAFNFSYSFLHSLLGTCLLLVCLFVCLYFGLISFFPVCFAHNFSVKVFQRSLQ